MASSRNCCCRLRPQDPNLYKRLREFWALAALNKFVFLEKCWKGQWSYHVISSLNLLRSMGSVTTWHTRHQLDERESLRLGSICVGNWSHGNRVGSAHVLPWLERYRKWKLSREIPRKLNQETFPYQFARCLLRSHPLPIALTCRIEVNFPTCCQLKVSMHWVEWAGKFSIK